MLIIPNKFDLFDCQDLFFLVCQKTGLYYLLILFEKKLLLKAKSLAKHFS
jgi:hypothetical protein